jgi:RHS repeat-associated protein
MNGDATSLTSGSLINTLDYEYDLGNQLTGTSDSNSQYAFTYDDLGRVLTVSNSGTSGVPTVVLTNVFDASSNRTSVSSTIGGTNDYKNTFTFDNLNRMTRIDQQGQSGGNTVAEKRIDLAYNALGQFTSIVRYKAVAGGTSNEVATSTFSYDTLERLTDLAYKKGGTNLFTAYSWTYDYMSRVTGVTSQDGTTSYTYDVTSQLTGADHSYQTDETYTYDANGNRTMTGYSTGTNNQLTNDGTYTYEYDNEGNRTKRTKTSDSSYTVYTWDYRNRLTNVTEKNSSNTVLSTVDYVYDTFDRRIKKSYDADGPGSGAAVVTRYVYDGDDIALQFDGSNNLTHRYLHGPAVDQILADEQIGGTLLWPLTDNLGTVRDLVNSSGTVQNHIKYDSFGKVTSESNSAVDHIYAFTGREPDEETGLQYHRARYLDVVVGRWVSEDPTGFAAKDWNLARYVHNRSLLRVDLTGHAEQPPSLQVVTTSMTLDDPLVPVPAVPNNGRPAPPGGFWNSFGSSLWSIKQGIVGTWQWATGNPASIDTFQSAYEAGPLGQTQNSSGIYYWGTRVSLGVSVGAIAAAGGVGIWEAAGGATYSIGIGTSASGGATVVFGTSPYGAGVAGTTWYTVPAVGTWIIGASHEVMAGAWTLTGFPVLFPGYAVGAPSAMYCFTAAARAFLRGWGGP